MGIFWSKNMKFLKADVVFPIIGADFLANFRMLVDLSAMLTPSGLKIPLEAPRAADPLMANCDECCVPAQSGGQ